MKVRRGSDVNRKSAEADRERVPEGMSSRAARFGMHSPRRLIMMLALVLVMAMALASCGGSGGGGGAAPAGEGDAAAQEGGYEPPEMKTAVFDEASAGGSGGALVDLSGASQGYFAVKVSSDTRIKLVVEKDDEKYIYDVVLDKVQIFPFQLGNGSYKISVMKNIVDNKYSELYSTWAEVSLEDEFGPFLRPSQYADFNADSKCVAKAAELAGQAADANGFITNVYDFVCKNVTYDREKAATVESGYLPVPDETMESGKGICFDYASLAASMLRSQGIPTKIIFGYVGEGDDLYHAWNMFYTEEAGWVAVEFEVSADEWNRLDLTFSANGEDSQFIGDGSNYLDVYQY